MRCIGCSRQPRFPAIASSYTQKLLSKHPLDNRKISPFSGKFRLTQMHFEQKSRVQQLATMGNRGRRQDPDFEAKAWHYIRSSLPTLDYI